MDSLGGRTGCETAEDLANTLFGDEATGGPPDCLRRQEDCLAGSQQGGSAPPCVTQSCEFGFVARLEGERLIELKPDSIGVAPGHDRADPSGSEDTCHGLRVVGTTELGDVKPNGQPLALLKATSVDGTGKGKPAAGNLDHQTEKAGLGGILAEPNGPLVTKSLFTSVVCLLIHISSIPISQNPVERRNRHSGSYCLLMDLKNALPAGDHRLATPGAGQT